MKIDASLAALALTAAPAAAQNRCVTQPEAEALAQVALPGTHPFDRLSVRCAAACIESAAPA